MRRSSLVALAILLDAIVGDPSDLPHPVRAVGATIDWGEAWLRSHTPAEPQAECAAGAALSLAVIALCASAGALASRAAGCEVPLAASTLALRSLIDESERVARALDASNVGLARESVARIVGRDTDELGESEIARATIEALAESLCDGVIAPLIYLTLGGTAGALAYKAVNTLDSMIGHIEPPYRDFGRVAARIDDAANWIPARIAAACVMGAAALVDRRGRQAFDVWQRDGDKSRSPNAGQMEAAMAGALGVRLGGINRYDGVASIGAVFAADAAEPSLGDVRRAQRLTVVAASIAYAVALIGARCFDER